MLKQSPCVGVWSRRWGAGSHPLLTHPVGSAAGGPWPGGACGCCVEGADCGKLTSESCLCLLRSGSIQYSVPWCILSLGYLVFRSLCFLFNLTLTTSRILCCSLFGFDVLPPLNGSLSKLRRGVRFRTIFSSKIVSPLFPAPPLSHFTYGSCSCHLKLYCAFILGAMV